jgi:uncharacterized membrane protein YfcA
MLVIVASLFALSLAAGFIGAIFGIGGGVLLVPALTLVLGMPIRVAIGVSLISVVATSAGASAAFVRDGWTNLRVAMALEVATTAGALVGASLAGVVSPRLLEGLFALAMVLSAIDMLRHRSRGDSPPAPPERGQNRDALAGSDALADRLHMAGAYPGPQGPVPYVVRRVLPGAALMGVAGLASGLLGIGAGVLKVMAMDSVMGMPFKVSSATSNFMIGVTAGAGALVFLGRGDIATTIAAPVALGVASGALVGSRVLVRAKVRALRVAFVVLLLAIAAQMGWRAAVVG